MPVKNVISHLWSADFSLSGRVLAVYGTYAGSQPANYSPKSFPKSMRETAHGAWGCELLLASSCGLFIQETFPEHQWCLDSWVTCLKIQWWKAQPLPSRSLRWSWRPRKEHRQFKHRVRSTTSGVNSGGKVRQGADHWGPGQAFGEIKSKPDLKI